MKKTGAFRAHSATAYLEQQRVLDKTLHGLEQKAVERVEVAGDGVVGGADFVEEVLCQLSGFSLVGNKRLVDVEGLLEGNKRAAPLLRLLRRGVGRLDADQEAPLDVEDGVDVEEDLMDDIAVDDAALLEGLFQVVQIFKILDILALGVDQLADHVVAVAQLRRRSVHFLIGRVLDVQKQATLFGEIEDMVDHRCHLDGSG